MFEMQLEDWLDDLCVRFIVNLPPEELVSVERICFQVEEAQWFYEDFIRPLDPSLPSLSLKAFSLRIFQHCPLFSTWSMHHYTSAFAEFLAYKQRVPVRGAILLNEEMDEVVLVKGWKKGANWSFPRGKINKDENDLDCAVREVYEETGYDIQGAGLVKPEKDMKYIEVTMREQHMRLYVFRGVPKDTYFEPKTRKEISKIEWYKLTELPTLKKKHAHHDAQEDNAALNANKFYMVAPFLHPLKKWISQQKKKENRFSSSHLTAPPLTMDESATEGEPGPTNYIDYHPVMLSPQVPSSLPEVATARNLTQDPSLHLKELLKIGTDTRSIVPAVQPMQAANVNATKSDALLSLLRNGPATEMRTSPHTPVERMALPAHVPDSIQKVVARAGLSEDAQQPAASISTQQAKLQSQQKSLLELFANTNKPSQTSHDEVPQSSRVQTAQRVAQHPVAPYQRTGDPQFSRDSPEDTRAQAVPPAHALPKLTHHTRALLDAFKVAPPAVVHAPQAHRQSERATLALNAQTLLEAFKSPDPVVHHQQKADGKVSVLEPPLYPPKPTHEPAVQNLLNSFGRAQASNASTLLNLFKDHEALTSNTVTIPVDLLREPVELAAGPMLSPRLEEALGNSGSSQKLRRRDAPKRAPQAIRAGETAATIDGPLNQPHFESVTKSPSNLPADSMRRSPVPAHRTLFDPKQPTPTKILQRVEEGKRASTKSPRPSKANVSVVSPKHKLKSKVDKPFQPQILKRPQASEQVDTGVASPTFLPSPEDMRKSPSPLPPPLANPTISDRIHAPSPPLATDMSRRTSQQTESQKQNLLSLLTGQSESMSASKPTRQTSTSGAVSPLTQSQVASPLGDEPISTRSRMGSLVSIASPSLPSDNRSKTEKRQTTAGDKAFLLGYLGRIASQEGQSQ